MKTMVGWVRGCGGDVWERRGGRVHRAGHGFFGVEAALVEEVAKRRLVRKRRLAAERWPVARAGADDGEPKLAVKRLLMAAQFLLAALRRRRQRRRKRLCGGERRLAAKRMLVAKLAS